MKNDFLFLYGPSGSGKTTLGEQLADALSLPFYELDSAIESAAGAAIPTLFQTRGEEVFRQMESDALEQILKEEPGVVALGGGALLAPHNRTLAEARGEIICLHAEVAELIKRLQQQPDSRPLLGSPDELQAKLSALLEERKAHYASFPHQMDTTGKTIEELVWEIQINLGRFQVSGTGIEYPVQVQNGVLAQLPQWMGWHSKHTPIVIVTDSNLAPLYLPALGQTLQEAGFQTASLEITAGETSKSVDLLEQLWEKFLAIGIERGSTVIALGGGVVGDLAGFAAATYMRGIRWINLPTSLLAMVDSSLGGKTAINLNSGKNLAGAFHSPSLVLIDPALLASLPEEELRNGAAEIIKHGVIADPILLAMCANGLSAMAANWETIIRRAVAVKVHTILQDPFEQDIRATLNFGHTVGHALEKYLHYQLRHGETVAIGMVAETRLAEHLGIARAGLADDIRAVLQSCGLPVDIPAEINRKNMFELMQYDKKKKDGTVRCAVPQEIGKMQWNVAIDEEAIQWLIENN